MAAASGSAKSQATSYRDAGVDLAAAESAKQRIARTVAGTRTPWVTGAVGAFQPATCRSDGRCDIGFGKVVALEEQR